MCFSRVVTPIVAGTVAGAVMGMVAAVAPASAGPTIVIDVNSGRVLSHEDAHYFSMEAVRAGDKILPNYNWLVGRFPGADGMKTGYICSSGFNLAATATRNGRTLATIVLGAPSQVERGEEAARLLAEGFQFQGAVAPSLQNFAPYGNGRNVAVDLRPQICSEAAVKARYERGDDDGMLVQRSPYLTAMDHEPRAVTIGLGGATGPAPSVPRFADVPIPTPRPDYPFKSATAETGQGG